MMLTAKLAAVVALQLLASDAVFALGCIGTVKPKAGFVGTSTPEEAAFTVAEARSHADFVFDAKIEKVTFDKSLSLASVLKTYKDPLPKKVLLSFSHVAGDCRIDVAPGQIWLIFAYRRPDTMEVDLVFSFHKPRALPKDFWTAKSSTPSYLPAKFPYFRDTSGPPRSETSKRSREQERRTFMQSLDAQPFFSRLRVIEAKLGNDYHRLHPDTSAIKACDPLENRPVDVFLKLQQTGRDTDGRFRHRVVDIQSMQSKYGKAVALCLSTRTITLLAKEPLKSQLVILETKNVLSPAAEFCSRPGKCLPVSPMTGF